VVTKVGKGKVVVSLGKYIVGGQARGEKNDYQASVVVLIVVAAGRGGGGGGERKDNESDIGWCFAANHQHYYPSWMFPMIGK